MLASPTSRPRAVILTIGDELLAGDIVDTNAAFLAARCRALGIEVLRQMSVRDRQGEISQALREAAEAGDVCLVSGGLGPTSDDLTTEAAAMAAGVPLERDANAAQRLGDKFRALGRAMPDRNLKQADFPRGAQVLANPIGTAEGFAVAVGARSVAYVMPGVPRELKKMMLEQVEPLLEQRFHLQPIPRRIYRTLGMGESSVADRVVPLLAAASEQSEAIAAAYVHYRASMPEVLITIEATANERGVRATAEDLAALDGAMREALQPALYGIGEASLPERMLALLDRHGLSLGLAESCTGGGATRRLAAIPGASTVLRGAIVAYHNDIKCDVLGVPQDVLQAHGAVSEAVALAMAAGARQTLRTDLAIAITGIAGPTGGTDDKPVGTVHVAVADAHGHHHLALRLRGTRSDIQSAAELWAFKILWDRLHANGLATIQEL